MSKPTPGKWFVNFDAKVVDADGNVVANCDHPIQPEGHRECLANARMCAASKDLWHACLHALASLKDAKDCEIVRDLLRSAIKRAEDGD